MSDAQGKQSSSRLVFIVLIGLILLAGVFSAGGFVLLLSNGGGQDVPIIKAENSPYKVRPDDPGGLQIDHQNSSVMGILEKLDPADETADRLQLPEAQPELPPVKLADNLAGDKPEPSGKDEGAQADPAKEPPASADKSGSSDAQIAEKPSSQQAGTSLGTSPGTSKEKPAEAARPAQDTTSMASQTEQAGSAAAEKPDPALPVARPQPPKPAKTARIIEKPIVSDPNKPQLMVQLAAFRVQKKAEEAAAILGRDHAERLAGSELGVMKIDTGSSGIFWRVITPALEASAAREMCDRLKRAGQDCILRRIEPASP